MEKLKKNFMMYEKNQGITNDSEPTVVYFTPCWISRPNAYSLVYIVTKNDDTEKVSKNATTTSYSNIHDPFPIIIRESQYSDPLGIYDH